MQNDSIDASTGKAKTLVYGSVCSGIEAATAAWHPIGWKAAFYSEIDPFPRALLQHHYKDTALHGDFTTIQEHNYDAIDLLVGGTPCQAFSVAGLRKGFADERGNLTLEFVRLAQRLRPRWLVWENVPGVLSIDRGRAFGSFLGGLAECGYGFAYRILDAQYFGVPQRRRRVFVIGYLGDWRPPAAVLFERESLLRDITPSREKGERASWDVAPSLTSSDRGVERTGESRGQDPVIMVAGTLQAGRKSAGSVTQQDAEAGLLIAHALNGGAMKRQDPTSETLIVHSLRADGFDASEDGTGRGTPIVPVAIPINMQAAAKNGVKSPNMLGIGNDGDPFPTLGANDIHAVAFDLRGREGGAMPEGPHDTVNMRAASGGSSRSYIAVPMAVRRITPTEAERLQGFPDGYTLIPYRGKMAADGPRYKALGNSMAVPVMRWIGQRIQMVNDLLP